MIIKYVCKIYLQYIIIKSFKINFYTALQIVIAEHFLPKRSLSRKPISI